MRLVVNHQLIPIILQPESIFLDQICNEIGQGIAVTSLHYLLFSAPKNRDLKQIPKSPTNVELALRFLWTSKFAFSSNALKLTI